MNLNMHIYGGEEVAGEKREKETNKQAHIKLRNVFVVLFVYVVFFFI